MTRLVTIERKKLDPNRAYGIIIAQSPALTLVHWVYDFQFDGYWVCRTKDITLCESPETNAHWLRLMRREGLWETVPRWIKHLSIEGWPELITDLVGRVVILEDEVRGNYHIGPILEAQAKRVVYHYFDTFGRLQDVEKVPYSHITSMQFGNRYTTIYAKYLTSDGQPIASTHSYHLPKRKR
jgi:hypothetical protein